MKSVLIDLSHRDEIIAVDLRYYKGGVSAIMEQQSTTDLMLLYNVIQLSNHRNFVYLK